MPANVETMFYVREKPWHGLGTRIEEAPTSADALMYAGLDWTVEQKNVYMQDGSLMLIELESAFWNHVQEGTPPPLDGSDASKNFLSNRFPISKPTSQSPCRPQCGLHK